MTALPVEGLRADAHISAAALHLLLAQHPELVELPIEWRISTDAIVRPFVTVDHPQGRVIAQLLARALELELTSNTFVNGDGGLCESLFLCGRWGGAKWSTTFYVRAEGGEGS